MRPCPTKRSKISRALWRSFPWNRYRGTRMCIILCEDPLLNAMHDSFKTTLIQGNLGTCGRNILPIRHKRSHDTSSGESSTKKNQTLSQNYLISSCSTFPSRTVHMRARQTLPNGCLNMGESIIKKEMCSYQRYGM